MDDDRGSDLEGPRPVEGPRGWHNRGYLPHYDGGEVTQHITIRLADSLPASVLEVMREEVTRERDHLGRNLGEAEAKLRLIELAEKYLDQGRGSCVLASAAAAKIVQSALLHFHEERYYLHDWCIMPNHAHVLVTPRFEWSLGKIAHSWKSFTSNRVNAAVGRSGQLWMYDYFDRYMRNESHFFDTRAYIVQNPVSAGLCGEAEEWPWSSACKGAGLRPVGSDLEGRGPG